MGIISRGFSGRRSAADVKLPPGQYLTTDFPVLSAGPTPHVSLDRWEFVIDDGTKVLRRWDWKSFRDLPSETFTVDLHCVTRWSKLGTSWEGWESRAAARCWAHPCCPPHDKKFSGRVPSRNYMSSCCRLFSSPRASATIDRKRLRLRGTF